jgi:hypothetical protein
MMVEESWASAMRAEALAKLLLTERNDLEVIEQPPGVGYDMLVRIRTEAPALVPEFAVEVKGTRRNATAQKLREWLGTLRIRERGVGLPWCLFVFQVEKRQGTYCWLYEPVVDENGAALLSAWELRPASRNHHQQISRLPSLSPLDAEALERRNMPCIGIPGPLSRTASGFG